MLGTLTEPVLSVAADVVRDIDGGLALSGLCTLFRKCKSSLQDGPRLENISWRLWHREMALVSQCQCKPTPPMTQSYIQPDSPPHLTEGKATFPDGLPEPRGTLPHHPAHYSSFTASTYRSTRPRHYHPHSHLAIRSPSSPPPDARPSRVGEIICDLLPQQILSRGKRSSSAIPIPAVLASPAKTSLPTPTADSEGFHSPVMSSVAVQATGTAIDYLCPTTSLMPPTPIPDRPFLTAPNVAIMDSAHDPTPHPTPPTSPNTRTTSGSVQASQRPSPSTPLPRQQPIHSRPSPASVKLADETLKPSDRRFFLQQSPEGDDSPERHGSSAAVATIAQNTATRTSGSRCARRDGGSINRTSSRSGRGRGSRSASRSASRLSSCSSGLVKSKKEAAAGTAEGKETSRSTSGYQCSARQQRTGLSTRGKEKGRNGRTGTREREKEREQRAEVSPRDDNTETAANMDSGKTRALFNFGVAVGEKVRLNHRDSKSDPSSTKVGETRRTAASGTEAGASTKTISAQRPQQQVQPQPPLSAQRRRIVVASTSSEYETTDTDTEDEGDNNDSWASEEMSEGDVVKVVTGNTVKCQDPTALATTTTTTATTATPAAPPNVTITKRKVHQPKDVEPVNSKQQLLEEAALEAQRQRELFAKVPVTQRSWSTGENNNASLGGRTRSGLLSLLMKPDPEIFPPGHPYRTSFSSGDFSALRTGGATHAGRGANTSNGASSRGNGRERRAPPGLHTSKSAVALPVAAQINATSLGARRKELGGEGGYRPKGRPEGQEMEDESESEDEDEKDTIQVSRSVAQQRLALLAAGRQCTNTNTAAKTGINANNVAQLEPDTRQNSRMPHPQRPALTTIATAPIPLGHPYNLPAPAPPSTPRTTRRQMLQTELSESLRRNLLWERRVSNLVMRAGARRQSSSGAIPGIGGINGLRPLTSMDEGEGRVTAMARHRSWADDYHTSGW